MINLHHVELFYYVARHGGISRAVRQIPYGIQQPAISGQIRQLERDIGVTLFARQPFRLTSAGQEFFAFIRPFYEGVEGVAAQLPGRDSPLLRIGASEFILRKYLPDVIGALKQQQPGTRVSLRAGSRCQLDHWLHEREIDIAIALFDAFPAGLESLPILRLPLVLLAPRARRMTSVAELWALRRITQPLVCPNATHGVGRVFQRGLKHRNIEWAPAVEVSSNALVPWYVAKAHAFGVSIDFPGLVKHRGICALPLEGFDMVDVAAVWRGPANTLLETFLNVLTTRANTLSRNDFDESM